MASRQGNRNDLCVGKFGSVGARTTPDSQFRMIVEVIVGAHSAADFFCPATSVDPFLRPGPGGFTASSGTLNIR